MFCFHHAYSNISPLSGLQVAGPPPPPESLASVIQILALPLLWPQILKQTEVLKWLCHVKFNDLNCVVSLGVCFPQRKSINRSVRLQPIFGLENWKRLFPPPAFWSQYSQNFQNLVTSCYVTLGTARSYCGFLRAYTVCILLYRWSKSIKCKTCMKSCKFWNCYPFSRAYQLF